MQQRTKKTLARCPWARSELAIGYHDEEWGTPQHDDRPLFELLILEGAQAGLSWETILQKRERYRKVFSAFDPARVARYDAPKVQRLLSDAGIVRNRLKIESAVSNARAFLAVQRELGSFARYLWSFTGGEPIDGKRRRRGDVPARTELSDRLSVDLRKRGFRFVGTTICYAFLQASGVVNDHIVECFRYRQLTRRRATPSSRLQRPSPRR
ncbi:MAG: DNA-3-methyladenine glycosylase I [Vulcanimicrobiaceae bacterium]